MIPLTASQIAAATAGRIHGSELVTVTGAVRTDSRLVEAGDLFVALRGETHDGHDFVHAAVDSGAAAVVAEREYDVPVPVIVVPDTLTALADLAREVVAIVRARGTLKVIAVTGSNGKTTTKNMVAAICAAIGPTVAPIASFNNEIGAPMTMLRVEEDTEFLVLEYGADAVGDIAKLVGIVQPDVAIVLTVGVAHIGKFGDQAAIALAKSELVRELPETATAVLNRDAPNVRAMADVTRAQVAWFGVDDVSDVSVEPNGTRFTLDGRTIRLRILGEHNAMNALAAIRATTAIGIPVDTAIAALEAMPRAERWRMEVLEAPDGVTVINDAYNASPDSMAAGLRTLAELTRGRTRAIAVLGEMAELGDTAVEEHDRIGRLVVRLNIDQLVVVGPGAFAIHLAAQQEGSWGGESVYVETMDDAYDVVRGLLRTGDVVLVKSSNSAGLRHLGDRLAGVSIDGGAHA